MFSKTSKGFTLIELSVVLVILGLLVGGIIGASRLVKVSKINSVMGNYREITQAMELFNSMYGELPGDTAITKVMGSKSDTSIDLIGKGNGNRQIEFADNTAGVESAHFYGHLNASEIFSGLGVPSQPSDVLTDCQTLSVNSFTSSIVSTDNDQVKVTPVFFNGGNYLVFSPITDSAEVSGSYPCAADTNFTGKFPKSLAESVDKKMDGIANGTTGQVIGTTNITAAAPYGATTSLAIRT